MKLYFTELGAFLKRSREAASLTQREASNKLKYASPQFVSNFERGIAAPPLSKLPILQRLYKIPGERIIALYLAGKRKKLLEELT